MSWYEMHRRPVVVRDKTLEEWREWRRMGNVERKV